MADYGFVGQIKEQPEKTKLDLLDRKILYLLCKNGRYSDTAIARALRVKRETVGYRIKRMTEKDFLHGCLTLIDSRRLGFRMHAVHLKLNKFSNEKQIISFLKESQIVTRLNNTCGGNFDIDILVTSKDLEDFESFIQSLLSRFADTIDDCSVLEVMEEDFMGVDFLLTPGEKKSLTISEKKGSTFEQDFATAKHSSGIVELDRKDIKLLDLLKLDGNIPISDLSKRLSLAVPAVVNRIKRLISCGVIKSFIPYASLSNLGYQWYMVFFQVKDLPRSRFVTYLKQHSHVTWYVKFAGSMYECNIFAKDNTEFNRILNQVRSQFSENIVRHESMIVLNQFKFVHRVS
jgi:DNA-binding Lrp family transcriptional regulator